MKDYLICSIEDDKDIAHIINLSLTKQGYEVKTFYDGESFLEYFKDNKPQMVLLDMMLPGIQGKDILTEIRKNPHYDDIEIIIISANRLTIDKVDGLDLGADDYIEKPFDVMELLSRVNTKYRRYSKKTLIETKFLKIDLDTHVVYQGNEEIDLTNKELEILETLARNEGKIVSRKSLGESNPNSRALDMHIKTIRQKLGDDKQKIIESIYGVGYKLN
jgi:Response regulators consisting of a CheY-like receiver domain and a winged-helix DNA-binding domain